MMLIYKYILNKKSTILDIPKDAIARHVATYDGEVYIWFELDPSSRDVKRRFDCIYTGGYLPDDRIAFVGSVITGNRVVHHIYECEVSDAA